MKTENIIVAIILVIAVALVLYYWWTGFQQPSGQLVFSDDSITLSPGYSTSVWLTYRPTSEQASSITVTLTTNTPYLTVYPTSVTLNPGESQSITISASSSISPGTYIVKAEADGLTAVLQVVIVGGPVAGTQATTLTYYEAPIAWKLESGQLVQVYQRVADPSPYSDLVYRGKVSLGSVVRLYVKLYPVDGDYWIGSLMIEIRADVVGRPDFTVDKIPVDNVYIDGKGWVQLPITFTPPEPTDASWYCYITGCTRQFFFKIYYWKQDHWELLYDPTDPDTRPSIEVQG